MTQLPLWESVGRTVSYAISPNMRHCHIHYCLGLYDLKSKSILIGEDIETTGTLPALRETNGRSGSMCMNEQLQGFSM